MDGQIPPTGGALQPRDEADVAEILGSRAAPLSVEGNGSKAGLGRPEGHDRLSLRALSGIIAYEPAELVLTAHAATPLKLVTDLLAQHRQHLAFEPPDWGPLYGPAADDGTLGGVLACNLSGSRRVTAGAARDHFLGFRAVNGRGEVFKAGGKVVKNVTGYDLPKLLAGSFGTLAVLTEVTVKVLPVPESRVTLCWSGLEDGAALACLTQALGSRHEVGAAAHLPATAASRLGVSAAASTIIRIEGPEPSTRVRAALLGAELAVFGEAASLADGAADLLWSGLARAAAAAQSQGTQEALWRVSVPPSQGALFIADLAVAPALHWYDWGGGLVWLAAGPSLDAVTLRAAAARAGGHAMLVRGDAATRSAAGLYGPQEAGLAALTRRIKDSFDPRGLLGPGRMRESH